jgi:hypothetical protein
MAATDDFQRKLDAHNEQIQALIRVAELQQTRLDETDDLVASIAQALAQERTERLERQKEMADRQKYFDERVDRLVVAIGEFVRNRN